MADQKDEEKRHAEMLEGLNKGIKEANGTLTDKEFVLIKRAKRKLKKLLSTDGPVGNVSDAEKAKLAKANTKAVASKTGGMLGNAVGSITDRERRLLEAEEQ